MNYYNEFDPFAAAWLKELIKAGHISQGIVDERSIEDVTPNDLRGYKQCHFFAGIGVWSYALRQAGWPDDREVWTGSCPCQPFSAAGKRGGTSDERHLWPSLFHLVGELRPRTIFGEQVASKDGLAWFGTVQADLAAKRYAVAATDLCAAGFGAPHIRQRLYFVADPDNERSQGRLVSRHSSDQRIAGESGLVEQLAYTDGRNPRPEGLQRRGEHGLKSEDGCAGSSVVNSESEQVGIPGRTRESRGSNSFERVAHPETTRPSHGGVGSILPESPESGRGLSYWSECDWLPCIDGKARPVEPGTFPLAHGITSRVGRLRGYGNALCAPVAQAFIEAYLESE